MNSYISLGIAAFLPSLVCIFIFILDKFTNFKNENKIKREIIIGILFGGVAIIGTEWGIPLNGAQLNARDAAPLVAAFLFGGHSGIIAGLIGGIERWFAVYWGVGYYTRVACSVSTIIAGIYGTILHNFLFEKKKPSAIVAAGAAFIMETFHLMLTFFTYIDEEEKAISIVQACYTPMTWANSLAVACAVVVFSIHNKDLKIIRNKSEVSLFQSIQRRLLLIFIVIMFVSNVAIFRLQRNVANNQATELIGLVMDEVEANIYESTDDSIIQTINLAARYIEQGNEDLDEVADIFDVSVISLLDSDGCVLDSSLDDIKGTRYEWDNYNDEFFWQVTNCGAYISDKLISSSKTNNVKAAFIMTDKLNISIGYNEEDYYKLVKHQIPFATYNLKMAEGVYAAIYDLDANLVSSSYSYFNTFDITTSDIKLFEMNGNTSTTTLNGEEYFYSVRYEDGYYILSLYEKDVAFRNMFISLMLMEFVMFLTYGVLYFLVYYIIKNQVGMKIIAVTTALSEISAGNLDTAVEVRSNLEFDLLSTYINRTVDTLKGYIEDANTRLDEELEHAKLIQQSALPSIYPAFPNRNDLDIYAMMHPAKEVGGDFYDYYFIDSDKVVFLIADVSGKGIPAAMFMMKSKSVIKSFTTNGHELNEVFEKANDYLCYGNEAEVFVTAWQGCVDLKTGNFNYVNAGHNPPVVKRSNGRFEYLKCKSNMVLAGLDGIHYTKEEFKLEKGDIVFLYTDGVTEATDANGVLYGEERLLECLNSEDQCYESMEDLCYEVFDNIKKFVGTAEQYDDITMLAFEYKSNEDDLNNNK